MRLSVSIMSHPKRTQEAKALYAKVKKMPFTSLALVFDDGKGEWDTGKRALEIAASTKSDYSLVLQDDAIIGKNFYTNLINAIQNIPEKTILSLYLGRVRPHMLSVRRAFDRATETNSSYISYSTLMWGVGICLPTKDVYSMLKHVERYPNELYDTRIGRYYLDQYKKVYYLTNSIVDHNDSLPSLAGHDHPNTEPRVAHHFTDEIQEFNKKVVAI